MAVWYQQKEVLMETPNIGLYYKMNANIDDNPDIMNADFIVILRGNDMGPIIQKKKFFEMELF